MADDDDDEAFGDFTFASSSSSSFSHPPQINIRHGAPPSCSKADAKDEEEDEWGDFVTPKSDSAANQSTWGDLKSGHFVGSVSDRTVPDRVKEVRARGALPLSIFGEEEGEEVLKEESNGSGFGGGEVFRGRSGELRKKGSDLSDLLASLYDQGGRGIGRDGKFADRKENGLKKEFDVLDLNANGYGNGFSSSGDDNEKKRDVNGSLFGFGMTNSGSDGFSSSAKAFDQGGVIKVESARRTKSDEYVFNFLSSGADDLCFSRKPFDAAVPVKTDNELDFNFNTPELGNDVVSNSSIVEVNGLTLDTKYSTSEDNDDDDGWEFQGITDVSKELEMTGANTLNNGPKLDSYKSESGPNELPINSSKENETRGKWEFMDFAVPSAKDESNEIWDFQGNGIPTAMENDDGIWDFQGVSILTPNDEQNGELSFADNSNASAKEEEDGGWEFQVAPVDQNPKQQWTTGVQSFGAQGSTLRSDTQVNKADGGQKGALPPSLFSDEPLDGRDPPNQDIFYFKSFESHSNGSKNIDPSASLSDLILDLYNQSEKKSSVESPEQAVTNSSDATQVENDSYLSNDEDDFDGTWDFKDASLSSVADGQSLHQALGVSYTVSKMENLVEFYHKLKDQSSLAAICHLASLKQAKSIAELDEDSEMEAFDEKIKDALDELKKANIVLQDAPDNCTPDNCLKEFHQVLYECKFQRFESEYGLSRRLSAAEKYFKPAIELAEHADSVLKLLSTGTVELQSNYISMWTEILFVCAHELQHGASIWQHAVERGVPSQILSQTKGKKFVHALGEIYRVVLIIEVSSRAYKPWILSNYTDGDSIFALLSECSTLWSSSGLDEALRELRNSADLESAEEVRALFKSINHILELDVPNGSLRQHDSVCGLSLLNGAVIPDVKMVVWDGETFFLPLANLWANLISSDPPKLPRIHAG